eukprot:scaffold545_cov372-Pavlova_lutheri.AAC.12
MGRAAGLQLKSGPGSGQRPNKGPSPSMQQIDMLEHNGFRSTGRDENGDAGIGTRPCVTSSAC